MSTILVTGGAGFIGSHLVDALVAKKHRVIVVDDLSVGRRAHIHTHALFHKLDITTVRVRNIFQKYRIDVVYHLAAQKDLQISKQEPVFDTEVNVLGSVRMLDLAKRHSVKKVIFFSTAAVYNPEARPPNKESDVCAPVTPYGIAKYATELYVKHSGVPYTILRLSNVYGPRQDTRGEGGVVAVFSACMARRKQCVINNTGRQTRDYIYVGDVVDAALKSLRRGHNQTLNISTGKETSVQALFTTLQTVAHTNTRPGHRTVAEQYRSALQNNQARRVLNWRPRQDLATGLSLTYPWFKETYAKATKKKNR